MSQNERQFIIDYVSIYSPTHHERPAAEFLQSRFEQWGWKAWIDAAGNACGEAGADSPRAMLCFLGHIDTVPGEIPVRVENGVLFGRGSVDAKGPLAAFACALARCADQLEHLDVRLIGAVEEECSTSKGARFAVEQYDRPDFLIIGEPSQWNRLTLGYKGMFRFNYELRQPRVHSAAEEFFPATKAVGFWNSIFEAHPGDAEHFASAFNQLTGNIASMSTASEDVNELAVSMGCELRLPPGIDPEELENILRQHADNDAATITIREALPAVRCERSTPLVAVFNKAIRACGGQPGFVVKTGTSDMNIAAPVWRCPTLAYGPGDSTLDHTPDEHLALDEFSQSVDVLERVLLNLDARLGNA
ncbi:[LysW]-lysine hydrolase [Candidatus Sumerlaeota bacterium]|nr:[LysW]-lysine hydrolase [Candidatus Sumerlaeota bacterium]